MNITVSARNALGSEICAYSRPADDMAKLMAADALTLPAIDRFCIGGFGIVRIIERRGSLRLNVKFSWLQDGRFYEGNYVTLQDAMDAHMAMQAA